MLWYRQAPLTAELAAAGAQKQKTVAFANDCVCQCLLTVANIVSIFDQLNVCQYLSI